MGEGELLHQRWGKALSRMRERGSRGEGNGLTIRIHIFRVNRMAMDL
jgi:hypothetical protein